VARTRRCRRECGRTTAVRLGGSRRDDRGRRRIGRSESPNERVGHASGVISNDERVATTTIDDIENDDNDNDNDNDNDYGDDNDDNDDDNDDDDSDDIDDIDDDNDDNDIDNDSYDIDNDIDDNIDDHDDEHHSDHADGQRLGMHGDLRLMHHLPRQVRIQALLLAVRTLKEERDHDAAVWREEKRIVADKYRDGERLLAVAQEQIAALERQLAAAAAAGPSVTPTVSSTPASSSAAAAAAASSSMAAELQAWKHRALDAERALVERQAVAIAAEERQSWETRMAELSQALAALERKRSADAALVRRLEEELADAHEQLGVDRPLLIQQQQQQQQQPVRRVVSAPRHSPAAPSLDGSRTPLPPPSPQQEDSSAGAISPIQGIWRTGSSLDMSDSSSSHIGRSERERLATEVCSCSCCLSGASHRARD
jgi:hypothetical protein